MTAPATDQATDTPRARLETLGRALCANPLIAAELHDQPDRPVVLAVTLWPDCVRVHIVTGESYFWWYRPHWPIGDFAYVDSAATKIIRTLERVAKRDRGAR